MPQDLNKLRIRAFELGYDNYRRHHAVHRKFFGTFKELDKALEKMLFVYDKLKAHMLYGMFERMAVSDCEILDENNQWTDFDKIYGGQLIELNNKSADCKVLTNYLGQVVDLEKVYKGKVAPKGVRFVLGQIIGRSRLIEPKYPSYSSSSISVSGRNSGSKFEIRSRMEIKKEERSKFLRKCGFHPRYKFDLRLDIHDDSREKISRETIERYSLDRLLA